MITFHTLNRPVLALALGAVLLAGCSAEEYDRTYARIDRINERVEYIYSNTRSRMHTADATRIPVSVQGAAETVGFVARSAALGPGQRAALDRFVQRHGLSGGLVTVAVVADGGPSGVALAQRRGAAVAAHLASRGVSASTAVVAEGAPGTAIVSTRRAVAGMPNCPEWRELMDKGDVDVFSYRLGCLNASSLAATVHRPADLVSGRPLANAKGGEFDRSHGEFRDGKSDPPPKPDGFTFGGGGGGASSSSSSGAK
jgi:type IV pilus biogenesis protein CpaD/CtpE